MQAETLSSHYSNVFDDCSFLWSFRSRSVDAPNVRLINLARADERLAALCDALQIAGDPAWSHATMTAAAGEPGELFSCAVLALRADHPERLGWITDILSDTADVAGTGANCQHHRMRAVISSLAWVDRHSAARGMDALRSATNAQSRAACIAATGARRSDPGPTLASALAGPSPPARARAYRTAGQLGRADLMANLAPGLRDDDPECRFWSAWAAARMGATGPLAVLADIARSNSPFADRALDLLLRRLDVPHANAWLGEFAKLPDSQRNVIRATGVIGDPLYIPWLIEHMTAAATARLAGESFSMITGLDLAYRDLDRRSPADFQSGPNDDPADESVALDEDDNLPWPDPARIGEWWSANRSRFSVGTAYFLGAPKATANWLEALSDAFQRQRHAAALELGIRQPDRAMFEVRARGRLQRQLLARARGAA